MCLFIAQVFTSPTDANELGEVQTHHLGGPEEFIQKWLCLESHHGLLSFHSPLLISLWSRPLQSCSLPLVQDHDPTSWYLSLGTAWWFPQDI